MWWHQWRSIEKICKQTDEYNLTIPKNFQGNRPVLRENKQYLKLPILNLHKIKLLKLKTIEKGGTRFSCRYDVLLKGFKLLTLKTTKCIVHLYLTHYNKKETYPVEGKTPMILNEIVTNFNHADGIKTIITLIPKPMTDLENSVKWQHTPPLIS